jgi:hypothetical protein
MNAGGSRRIFDESLYWMELLLDSNLVPANKLTNLMAEIDQIVAMIVASIKTLRSNTMNPKSKIQNRHESTNSFRR